MLRNLDVIHGGFGACVVPFGFLEMWSDKEGVESHTDFRFSNIRLEDFYSLAQIRLISPPGAEGIVFSNIAAMDGVGMVPSVLEGPVRGVALDGVRMAGKLAAQDADVPLEVSGGAAEPTYGHGSTDASWDYAPGLIRPGEPVTFRVIAPAAGWQYAWLFGDGSSAVGAVVRHAFPDAQGTLLDGSGRFRVLLHATRQGGDEAWASRGVVVAEKPVPAEIPSGEMAVGLADTPESGRGSGFDGWVRIPADGGYTFTLLTSRKATLSVDDLPPAQSPELRIEVCGSMGDAVQPVRLSAALQAGMHRIRIALDAGIENEPEGNVGEGGPMLLWEGPGILPKAVPAEDLVHAAPQS